jgi:hypothetical protein
MLTKRQQQQLGSNARQMVIHMHRQLFVLLWLCCPAGHVMGLATWKAVLSETGRCPFTKAPLRPDMLTVLTVNNIEKHRARLIAMS